MLIFELFPAFLMILALVIGIGLFVANRRADAADPPRADAKQSGRD